MVSMVVMVVMMTVLGADSLGHLGGDLDWNIFTVFYGRGGTFLLRDFLTSFHRQLLTRFHWFLKGLLGTLLYWNLLAFLYRLQDRDLVTALLWNLVTLLAISSISSITSITSMTSITTVTSITSVSTGSTDHFVSGLTLLLL